jgi:inward rectifier potassium channel
VKRKKNWFARSALPQSPRIISRDGQINVERVGNPKSWKDGYHFLLTISWPSFLGLIALGYLATNGLFALLYMLEADAVKGARPGAFWDYFFFSVQTIGTIGYGVMHPQTFYANLLVTAEVLIGLLGFAMATGLMFARFARPTARVLFSDVAVIMPHHQVLTLMFRMANQRRNQILEAQVRVSLLVDEISPEGYYLRRFYDIPLNRGSTQSFALTWTAMHTIDANSPFFTATPESLEAQNAVLLVSLVGLDETFAQPVNARCAYIPEEILWNMKFEDVIAFRENGQRYIDYTRFHNVLPLE